MRPKLIVNVNNIWIALVIFLNLNAFYLVDSESIPINDIALIMEILFWGYVCFFKKGHVKYEYKWLVLLAALFAVCSAFVANIKYAQPFFLGIRAQRHWLGALLMYFPLSKLLKTERISGTHVLKLIDTINLIYMVLVFVQYFLGDKILFLHVQSSERYDSLRLYVSLAFVMISYCIHLHKILECQRMKIRDLFWCIIPLFMHCFITKSRMGIVAIIGTTLIATLSVRFSKRKLFLVTCVVALMMIFINSEVGQDVLSMVLDKGTSAQDTSEIRNLGRTFFIESNLENLVYFLFGSGYANLLWPTSLSLSGYNKGYYYIDNGIFGLFFYYGITFVLWLVSFYVCLIRKAWENNKGLAYYLIFGVLGMYSLMPACYDTTIAFPIIVALLESNLFFEEREKLL